MISREDLKSLFAANRVVIMIGAGVTTLVGIVLLAVGAGRNWSFDLPTLLVPPPRVDNLVIVKMDETAYKKGGVTRASLLPRSLHAELLDRLAKDQARLAVFDFAFTDNSSTNEDQRFAASITNFNTVGKVVAAVERVSEGRGFIITHNQIASNLEPAFGLNLGDHRILPENDLWIREHRELSSFPSLAWVAAKACDAPITKTETERLKKRWIRYYGRAGTLPNMSYAEALDLTNTPSGFFRGLDVFIGGQPSTDLAGKAKEEFGTPFTRVSATATAGVEIQATMFLNLLRKEWLTEMPAGLELGLVVLAGIVFGTLLSLLKPLRGLVVAGTSMIVVFAAALLLFWWLRTWFDWLVIVAAQLPAAWAASFICYVSETGDRTLIDARSPWPDPNFEMLKSIGEGSFGEVWLARGVTGAYVALKKVYRGKFLEESPYLREWTGVANFFPISREHPNWVCVLHVVKYDGAGFFYYAMEVADDVVAGQRINPDGYVPKTLKALLSDGRWLPVKECVNLGIALSDAIWALHEHGFIHRDVKPSNIIFVKNVPKLADIGLVVRSDQTITFIGTEDYIPPERASSRLADIYALGKVLYQAATGSHAGDYPGFPTSLRERNDGREVMLLMDIVNKACESNPADRYQSGAEMREDLKRLGNLL